MNLERDDLGGAEYPSNTDSCLGVPEAVSLIFANHLAALGNEETAHWVNAAIEAVDPVLEHSCPSLGTGDGQVELTRGLYRTARSSSAI